MLVCYLNLTCVFYLHVAANLASFLTIQAVPKQAISSIEDVIMQNALVCYSHESQGYLEKLQMKYPNLHTKLVDTSGAIPGPIDRTRHLLEAIGDKNNACAVGMLPSKVLTYAVLGLCGACDCVHGMRSRHTRIHLTAP
jgi:hypothetical protein